MRAAKVLKSQHAVRFQTECWQFWIIMKILLTVELELEKHLMAMRLIVERVSYVERACSCGTK